MRALGGPGRGARGGRRAIAQRLAGATLSGYLAAALGRPAGLAGGAAVAGHAGEYAAHVAAAGERHAGGGVDADPGAAGGRGSTAHQRQERGR